MGKTEGTAVQETKGGATVIEEGTGGQAASGTRAEFRQIALKDLHESDNTRKHFDEIKLAELAESAKTHGIVEPLLVRSNKAGFEIVAGARRYRAAKLAKLETVPCLVRELTDIAALEIQTIENLQREDVSPLEEGEGYQRLIDKAGYDPVKLAAKIGKSVRYVYGRLEFVTKLAPETREALAKNLITASHALEIVRLQTKDQVKALRVCFDGSDDYLCDDIDDDVKKTVKKGNPQCCISVRGLQEWIARDIHRALDGAAFNKDDSRLAGCAACRDCTKRSDWEFGKTTIDSKAQCLDPVCFQKKLDAQIAKEIEDLKAAGADNVIRVATQGNYQGEEKGVLGKWQFEQVKPNAKGAVQAVDMDSGRAIHVKLPECNPIRSENTAQARAAQQRENEKARIERAARREAIRQIYQAMDELPKRMEIELIVRENVRLNKEELKTVAGAMGWSLEKLGEGYDACEKFLKKQIGELSDPDLWKLLLLDRLAKDVDGNGWRPDGKKIAEVAGWRKIDVEKIRAEIKAGKNLKPQASSLKSDTIKGTEIRKAAVAAKKGKTPKAKAKSKKPRAKS